VVVPHTTERVYVSCVNFRKSGNFSLVRYLLSGFTNETERVYYAVRVVVKSDLS